MAVNFDTDFALVKNYSPQKNFLKSESPAIHAGQNESDKPKSNKKRNAIIGIAAATILITLGVLGKKYNIIGKSKKAKLSKPNDINSETRIPTEVKPEKAVSKNEPKTPVPDNETNMCNAGKYSTKLPATVKEYHSEDINVYGILGGKPFGNGEIKSSQEVFEKVLNKDLTVIYYDKQEVTEILLPAGTDMIGVKINGIISQEQAKNIIRTINANSISKPEEINKIATDVLNGKLNTQYTIKNIGISYDFHDTGDWVYHGGGGKAANDARTLLRDVLKNRKWEGTVISRSISPNNGKTTTQIAVALPTNGGERPLSNNYSIYLDGLIPLGTCEKLIRYLENTVIANPKDVKYEELAKIQSETLRFLNIN